MKFKNASFALAVLFCVSTASAQVTGSGTNHTIPIWTGTTTLGNSPILSAGGNVAIGTTTPNGKLTVVSTSTTANAISGNANATSGYASGLYGTTASSTNYASAIYGEATGVQLYDNFNQPFIDPSKWSAVWQCGSPAMECVREIENGQLRLRIRAYGAVDSNVGTQYANSAVNLTADLVNGVAAEVTVRNSSLQDCATNSGVAHAQVLVSGSFFNGGGTSADDVVAFLQLDRSVATGTGTVEVGGFLQYQGQFFANVYLGPANIGEQVIVGLLWDQPNHRFVAELDRPKQGTKVVQYMPYTISDTTPPAAPFKSLSANVFPPNCQGTSIPTDLDVMFDNVFTKTAGTD